MARSRLLACPPRNPVEAEVVEQALDITSHETACLPREEVWIWNTRLAALSDTRLLSCKSYRKPYKPQTPGFK